MILPRRGRALALLLVILGAGACQAAAPKHTLWEATTADGRSIAVMGSVHVLRPEDYPLPAALREAYQQADTLVLELDMAELDEATVARLFAQSGLLEQGKLSDHFDTAQWQQAQAQAGQLGIPLGQMQQLKPWLAALTVLQLRMAQLRYDPKLGVDQHFADLAQADGKPVLGLETLAQQLAMFDGMPPPDQRALLLQSLEEAAGLGEGLGQMLDAWRHGRTVALAAEMSETFSAYPALYESLVVRRNREWAQQIGRFEPRLGNVLVVVGALHLVGQHSLVEMLRAQGLDLRQR